MSKEFSWTIILTQTDRIQKHPCCVQNVDRIPLMYLIINTGGQVQVASPFQNVLHPTGETDHILFLENHHQQYTSSGRTCHSILSGGISG